MKHKTVSKIKDVRKEVYKDKGKEKRLRKDEKDFKAMKKKK